LGLRSGPGDKRGFHWTLKRRRIHPGLNVSEKVSAFLLVYTGLFPIINPIGGAPIFLGLTRHCTDEERHSLAGPEGVDSHEVATTGRPPGAQDAFYPFTLPLTVGPGAISVAIALGTQRPRAANLYDLIVLGGAAIAALLAISATIYVCYRFAELIVATLGERGTTVMVRLSAFVLLCIGIEIISSGYSALVGTGR